MRTIIEEEIKIIDKIISLHKEQKLIDFIIVSKFIREELGDIIAIETGCDEQEEYISFYKESEKWIKDKKGTIYCCSNEFSNELLYKISLILNLFSLLEENGFAHFYRQKDNRKPFYDYNRYENFQVLSKCKAHIHLINDKTCIELQCQKYYGDMSGLFNKYSTSIMLPLPALEEFKGRGFVSLEQYLFNSQLETERKNYELEIKNIKSSLLISRFAIFVSIAMPLIIYILSLKWSPDTTVKEEQLLKIESAIKSTKTEYPSKIEVSMPDTITVKDIENNKIINNIHIDNAKTKDAQPK